MIAACCDTSVLVPALVSWHEHHVEALRAVEDNVSAIPAHVLVETFSVLTRLPAPHRLAPPVVVELLEALPHDVIGLPSDAHLMVIRTAAAQGVRGGAIHDAVVAATAVAHGCELVSLDGRARPTYAAVGVSVRLLA